MRNNVRPLKSLVSLSLLTSLSSFLSLTSLVLSQAPTPTKLDGYELTFPAMGSTITLNAYSDSEAKIERAFGAVRIEIDRLVAILSDYEPDSELNRNHRQATQTNSISEELFQVLKASEEWFNHSDGAFDAAIGNLTRRWREARKLGELPSQTEIDEAMRHSGWQKIELNKTERTLTLLDPEVRIDLGGIAAGYIVDRAFEVLLAHGLKQVLVNDGGDIRCGESPPGREGWRIEIASIGSTNIDKLAANSIQKKAKPKPRSQIDKLPPLRRIYLKNAAITTSGDLWQFIEIDGQRRSHILDPRTGYGVPGPAAVVLIAPTCIEADAGATTLSVLGPTRGLELITKYPGYEALMASRPSSDGSIVSTVTSGFPIGIFQAAPDASH
ncbi:MAG: FAD:protein FMN transferase [Pirellulaceae bacterium]|nr:FAD:protein FMN transferase [Pirellulaceae bacterium]